MPTYNKLVRDRIPEIIESKGKSFQTKKLSDADFFREVQKKLQEETEEYLEAKEDDSAVEELADILELIHTLAQCHGASIDEVEDVRRDKAEKRGAFQDQVFLIRVED